MRSQSLLSLLVVLAIAANSRGDESANNDSAPIHVTIDAAKTGPPINPFIYGQFIEHLGRCIYGGIWAEMLEDRKFYFPITAEYKPYRSLTNTKFPVVGASPWAVLRAGKVEMVKETTFNGEHLPQLARGAVISQMDLSFEKDKEYVGYAWLRTANDAAGQADVQVSTFSPTIPVSNRIQLKITNQFRKYDFKFKAPETTDRGSIDIFNMSNDPVVIGPVSLMPADNVSGFRRDTLALLKQLGAPIYRWPGGNFVSGYDWRDGIGPRDRRPPRKNPAWTGVEHNDVGIDEFIDLCREINTEPMIAVNTGFGDDYSAAQEVAYTNGSKETTGGLLRVENGHDKPYGVKYWCVGNEMWGDWQLGHIHLGQYVQKHNLVAKAMRKVDPNLVLVASGDLGTQGSIGDGPNRQRIGWSEGMLQKCADNMDFISEHFYAGRLPWTKSGEVPLTQHVGLLAAEIRKKATSHRELQAKLGRKPEEFIPIAMDEWNYWHRDYVYGELGCEYSLADALGVAVGLHEYFRNTDIVHMANYAQTVNVIGCIKTTKTAAFFDTTALPLMLYRQEFGTSPLAVTGNQNERAIDVAAAKTKDGGAITIGVVNPQAKPQAIRVAFDGAKTAATARAWRIGGDDPAAKNAPDKPKVAITEETQVPFGETITVPAYSVNVYRVAIQ